MPTAKHEYDLEERLLAYAADVIRLAERVPSTRAGIHVADQLLRAGTSPLFNHGEAQAAESARDFVHKLRICLKELREAKRALRLIQVAGLIDPPTLADLLLQETDELIRIFAKSIRTVQQRELGVTEQEGSYMADSAATDVPDAGN